MVVFCWLTCVCVCVYGGVMKVSISHSKRREIVKEKEFIISFSLGGSSHDDHMYMYVYV